MNGPAIAPALLAGALRRGEWRDGPPSKMIVLPLHLSDYALWLIFVGFDVLVALFAQFARALLQVEEDD